MASRTKSSRLLASSAARMRIDRSKVIEIRVWKTSSSVGGTADGAVFGSGRRVLFGVIDFPLTVRRTVMNDEYRGKRVLALSGRAVLLSKPDKGSGAYGRPHGRRAAAARSPEGPPCARCRHGPAVSCGAGGTERTA